MFVKPALIIVTFDECTSTKQIVAFRKQFG